MSKVGGVLQKVGGGVRTPRPPSGCALVYVYSNMVIGTLTVDGWVVTFGTARRGLAGLRPLLAVPNVTAHPSTVSVPTSYYSTWLALIGLITFAVSRVIIM